MSKVKSLAGGGIELLAPAKINLFLEVGARREDGYHELFSLVSKIALFDRIQIIPSFKTEFLWMVPPYGEENIVARAFRLFEKTLGRELSFQIRLEKRIPMEAGLGGGSSDAAAVLWGLNELMGTPFSLEKLHFLGAKLGSDVPLFFYDSPVMIVGRGEQVFPYKQKISNEGVTLVVPPFGLSTKAVYETYTAQEKVPFSVDERIACTRQGAWTFFNDLEKAAFLLRPELSTIKNRLLRCGFDTVMMSGSGSALFCIGKSSSDPLECDELRKHGLRLYSTKLMESN